MRYRPNYLDRDLAEQIHLDFARVAVEAAASGHPEGSEFCVAHTQAGYVYDLLRSLCEGHRLLAPGDVAPQLIEELMAHVQSFQEGLRTQLPQ